MDRGLKEGYIRTVNKQIALYRSLKEAIEGNKKALTGSSVELTESPVKKTEAVMLEIKKLEAEKKSIFEKMAEAAGFTAGSEAKLQDVLLKAGGQDSLDVENAVVELIKTVKDVAALNAGMAHMLKKRNDYIEFSRAIKEKIENPAQTTYDSDGVRKTKKADKKHRIDQII